MELEGFPIETHGRHLTNWVNPGRRMDYKAVEEVNRRRNLNRQFVAETRAIETNAPEDAVERYRRALAEMDAYEAIPVESGLLVELQGQRTYPDVEIPDGLTLCLVKLNRPEDAAAVAAEFFERYPWMVDFSAGRRIAARVAKATEKAAKRGR